MSKVLSGQKTITTAGVAVTLGSGVANETIFVKADPSNTGKVFIGNDTVTSGNGYPLAAGEVTIYEVGRISDLYATADANNQKVGWTVLNV